MVNHIQYLLALHSINGLGPVRLKALLEYFQDPKLAWQAHHKEILELGIPKNVVDSLTEIRQKLDPEGYAQKIKDSGISWLTIFDENYPKHLKEIYDPPIVLYYKGEILPVDEQAVAVVGTRKITSYGRLVTGKLTQGLVESGLTIVSGLARGVDTKAHQTALENHGRTLAVLGGGLNKIFPAENYRLAQEITDGGGAVLSEFPPDHPPLPGNFPARNRIISGLSLAVLITEASEDSGSLITAKLALEQGREVFAVPGPITSELSKGPASLIKQGARLVTDAEEIIEELGLKRIKQQKFRVRDSVKLTELEQKVIECITNEGKHIDEISRSLNLPIATVSATLIKMEIAGLVENLGGGNYTKIC